MKIYSNLSNNYLKSSIIFHSSIENQSKNDFKIENKKTTYNDKVKKNNVWKYVFGSSVLTGIIAVIIAERKSRIKLKLEKEAAEKAKKELEETIKREKVELEKKLKEEQKKWDDFFKNRMMISDTSTNLPNSSSKIDAKKSTSNFDTYSKTPKSHKTSVPVSTQPRITKESVEEFKDLQEKTNQAQKETRRLIDLEMKNRILSALSSINSATGLSKVVGYNQEKQFLINKIVTPIVKNQNNKIPNLLILYGPKGTGKTFIAQSIIEETGCNVINIENSLDTTVNYGLLNDALKQADEKFKRTGKRSFIKIEEFDSFIDTTDDALISSYKELIEKLSKNHATLITTTNHPQNINRSIIQASGCEKLYFPPIRKNDIPALIKHYADVFVDDTVDYQELANVIINNAERNAYSNDHIATLITSKIRAVNSNFNEGSSARLVNQNDLLEIFRTSSPDILKEVLDSYK